MFWARKTTEVKCYFHHIILSVHTIDMTNHSPGALVVKISPANAGDKRGAKSIPGLGKPLGGGNGNLLQYSYLENSMDRRGWQATDHRLTKNWT